MNDSPPVRVLGPVLVEGPSGEVQIKGPRESAVLALLAVRYPESVTGEWLAEAAWGGADLNTVHVAVGRLRKKFARREALTTGGRYALTIETDYQIARRALSLAYRESEVGRSDVAVSHLSQALHLWRGDSPDGRTVRNSTQNFHEELDEIPQLRRTIAENYAVELERLHRDGEILSQIDDFIRRDPYNSILHQTRAAAAGRLNGPEARRSAYERSEQLFADHDVEFPDNLIRLKDKPERSVVLASDSPIRQTRHSLPGARYTTFIHGNGEIDRLFEGLKRELPILALTAVPGRGRSVIAHYFAGQLVAAGAPFRAVVWISDEKAPGSITLNTVLDSIVDTCRNEDLGKVPPDLRAEEIRIHLAASATLVVIDAEDGIDNPELIDWLSSISGPSKILLCGVKVPSELQDYVFHVKVDPPGLGQRQGFIDSILVAHPIEGVNSADDPRLLEIWDLVHGNYKDVALQLGRARRIGLSSVLRELRADPSTSTVLKRSWGPLSAAERSVMLLLSCFRHGASFKTLTDVLGHLEDFESALFSLVDLSLVTTAGQDDIVFEIEPAALALVDPARFLNDPELSVVVELWLSHVVALAYSVGFCPDDLDRLLILDNVVTRRNLEFALAWCVGHDRFADAIAISRESRYYYYVRGLWSSTPDMSMIRANVARQIGDFSEELGALVYRSNIAAKQHNPSVVAELRDRINELLDRHGDDLPENLLAQERHARALDLMNRGQHDEAEALWDINLSRAEALGEFDLSANLRWYATSLLEQKDNDAKRQRGEEMLREAHNAVGDRFWRVKAMTNLQLIRARLGHRPSADTATSSLVDLDAVAPIVERTGDARYSADYLDLRARCLALLGDDSAHEIRSLADEKYRALGIPFRVESGVEP